MTNQGHHRLLQGWPHYEVVHTWKSEHSLLTL